MRAVPSRVFVRKRVFDCKRQIIQRVFYRTGNAIFLSIGIGDGLKYAEISHYKPVYNT